ncbi:MAG: multicopper oxidase domain-containing protein [Flavobacteriales bacterium]|nr:multicopper oxidase domain-containing protein [Flavobacteriales bacterium]
MKTIMVLMLSVVIVSSDAQNPLLIPPILEGPVFDLSVQIGSTEFFPGITTTTYGVNGDILGPTLLFDKGETVQLNVTNNLSSTTTMHWHGLHVSALNDGGPHQLIEEGATWSPQFEVMNHAGTFWYHPHGEGKTDFQVSKGIAGFIIVKDDAESALELPRTYGVDDFPLVLQTKSFDILNQIQIATHADTTVMVNATVNAYLDVPAQVVRFRLLNGASDRTFLVGLSNDMEFSQIGTDGGLLQAPNTVNRIRVANGERFEILVDFSAMEGQSVYLMSYGSELPDGIMGAETVGMGMAELDGYSENPLNGTDFQLLQLNVVQSTENAVTTVPPMLVSIDEIPLSEVDVERTLTLSAMEMGPLNMIAGPFGINGVQFNMEAVNITCHLDDTELWTINNQTQVAHPFHIHDVEFLITDVNGNEPDPGQMGWKDVVLVMPMASVSFITRFEHFADPVTPYMYHCHLLHHEDEGMMGSFVVTDPNPVAELNPVTISVAPNPVLPGDGIFVASNLEDIDELVLRDMTGREVCRQFPLSKEASINPGIIEVAGIYLLIIKIGENFQTARIMIY